LGGSKFTILTPADSRRGFPHSWIKYARLLSRAVYSSISADFDLIHAHAILPAGAIALIPKLITRKKFVVTVHGSEVHELANKPAIIRLATCFIVRRAEKVICVSEYLAGVVSEQCRVDKRKVEIVDMGVELEEFHPVPKEVARQELLLSEEGNRSFFVYVGNLNKVKGVAHLIEAVSLLKQRGRERCFAVYVVGHGAEEQALKKRSYHLGIDHLVHFVGNQPPDRIPLWMAAADVVVVPSLAEGFGLVAVEAMACGRPVIASNTGGLAELINPGVNGALVEPGNALELSMKMEEFLDDQTLFTGQAEQILGTAREHDAGSQARRVQNIYEQLRSSRVQ
jgi:glycosyltransferase involved in cell wall biosynthesis